MYNHGNLLGKCWEWWKSKKKKIWWKDRVDNSWEFHISIVGFCCIVLKDLSTSSHAAYIFGGVPSNGADDLSCPWRELELGVLKRYRYRKYHQWYMDVYGCFICFFQIHMTRRNMESSIDSTHPVRQKSQSRDLRSQVIDQREPFQMRMIYENDKYGLRMFKVDIYGICL